MSSELKSAIAEYRSTKDEAFDRLKKRVQLELERACRRWGFRFQPGLEEWYLGFAGRNHVGHECRYFMELLEPELLEVLDTEVSGIRPLGSYLEEIRPSKEEYEWVIFQESMESMGLTVDIVECDTYLDHRKCQYFGPLPRQVATAIAQNYEKDVSTWRRYSYNLPQISKPYLD